MSGAEIQACPDGPLIVRGDVEIVDAYGRRLTEPGRTVALCRCGASSLKPLCDGTHKLGRFRSEQQDPPSTP